MQYTSNPVKKIWYKEFRIMYLNIINPMSNYFKSKLDQLLEKEDMEKLTMNKLIKILHNELEKKHLSTEDKVKILKQYKTIRHKK